MKKSIFALLVGIAVATTAVHAQEVSPKKEDAPPAANPDNPKPQDSKPNVGKQPVHKQGHHHTIEHKSDANAPVDPPKRPLHDHRESK
ncbi:MAG TPA: hypothetical protein VJU83_12090 [Burkholderiales bacterium]|nr:hypothetical protein [Burkholderiales bacterium]